MLGLPYVDSDVADGSRDDCLDQNRMLTNTRATPTSCCCVTPVLRRDAAVQGFTLTDHDFLTLWKDGDTDIPTLIGAKAEYTKLK